MFKIIITFWITFLKIYGRECSELRYFHIYSIILDIFLPSPPIINTVKAYDSASLLKKLIRSIWKYFPLS